MPLGGMKGIRPGGKTMQDGGFFAMNRPLLQGERRIAEDDVVGPLLYHTIVLSRPVAREQRVGRRCTRIHREVEDGVQALKQRARSSPAIPQALAAIAKHAQPCSLTQRCEHVASHLSPCCAPFCCVKAPHSTTRSDVVQEIPKNLCISEVMSLFFWYGALSYHRPYNTPTNGNVKRTVGEC